jgi:hypothetical protein
MTHLTTPAELDDAKIQTSRFGHDLRSRVWTTVLLYTIFGFGFGVASGSD